MMKVNLEITVRKGKWVCARECVRDTRECWADSCEAGVLLRLGQTRGGYFYVGGGGMNGGCEGKWSGY